MLEVPKLGVKLPGGKSWENPEAATGLERRNSSVLRGGDVEELFDRAVLVDLMKSNMFMENATKKRQRGYFELHTQM